MCAEYSHNISQTIYIVYLHEYFLPYHIYTKKKETCFFSDKKINLSSWTTIENTKINASNEQNSLEFFKYNHIEFPKLENKHCHFKMHFEDMFKH